MFDALQRYVPLDSDTTNTAIISVTAVAGVLAFVFTFTVLVLNARKNHLTKLSSSEKDRQIQLAQKQAADANERAGNANLRAAEANERAGQAHERAGILEMEAAQARERQAELAARAETLHAENLALELSLADRLFEDQGSAANKLSGLAGMRVRIMYLNDAECKSTAEQIAVVLRMAKASIYGSSTSEMMADGVSIGVGVEGAVRKEGGPQVIPTAAQMRIRGVAGKASEKLAEVFTAHSILSRVGPPDSLTPVGEVSIRVGTKIRRPNRVKEPENGTHLSSGNRRAIPEK